MDILRVCLVLVLAVASASAADRRVALVIGNAAYPDAPLVNPVNDARAIAEALARLGFATTRVEDADQRAMKQAIDAFGDALKSGGVGLFYFSGHGLQVRGRNYLVPVGAKIGGEADVEYEGVDAGRVLAKMADAGNPMNVVILDACRNNPFTRSFRSTSKGLAMMDAPSGSVVVYATAPGDVASDNPGGTTGLYTTYLLKHLPRPGLKIEDVLKAVRGEVSRASGGKQVPWESSSLVGDFFFASGAPESAPRAAPVVRDAPASPVPGSPPGPPPGLSWAAGLMDSISAGDGTQVLRACVANRDSIDKAVGVWEAINVAIPDSAPSHITFANDGSVIEAAGVPSAVPADVRIAPGSRALIKIVRDENVFSCPKLSPAERAKDRGSYRWIDGPSPRTELGGRRRGTICAHHPGTH